MNHMKDTRGAFPKHGTIEKRIIDLERHVVGGNDHQLVCVISCTHVRKLELKRMVAKSL